MKLDIKKDRKEINNIIRNILPLMIKNKNLTQECADCIIVYFIDKMEYSFKTSKMNQHVKSEGTKDSLTKA